MSSVNPRENRGSRNPKGFHTTSIVVELVGPKRDPFGVARWIMGLYSHTKKQAFYLRVDKGGIASPDIEYVED